MWIRLFGAFLSLLLLVISASPAMLAQATPLPITNTLTPSDGALTRTAFSADGRWLAVGGRDNKTYLYDAQTQELVRTFDAMNDWVTGLAFSPDATRLVTGSRRGVVWLWEIATGAIVARYFPTVGEITSIAFSAEGDMLATASRDGTVALYHIPTEQEFAKFTNYGGAVWEIAFTGDGTQLATASEDGTVWLFGLWDGTLARLSGHTAPVASLAFSADGTRLVTGGLDGTVRVWENFANESDVSPALTMQGHLAPILGVGFSADARVGFSASLDGTVRVWDVAGRIRRGRELTVLKTNAHPLVHLAMSHDHATLATVGTDGALILWDASPRQLAALFNALAPVAQATPRATNVPSIASITQTEATPRPSTTTTGRWMSIPRVGIASSIKTFPLGDQTWLIDPYEPLIGHFQGTAWLDTVGNVVVGAHSEYPNGRGGTFRNLDRVGIGDEIFVRDGELEYRYVVVNTRTVDYRDVSVVYPTPNHRLTLITCDIPSYVAEQNIYYGRLVVVAERIDGG